MSAPGAEPPRFAARQLSVDGIGPVDFALEAGICVGLSGPSGAGKTRLLRAMADLDAHTGACCLDGRPATAFAAPEWRRQVMFLAAEAAWWTDTAGAALPHGDDERAAWLAALDLAPALLDRPLSHLSSGQRQRLALLRVIARAPSVLLLDEPTANLDADNIARVEDLIATYRHQRHACCVWVSHDHDQIARVTDQQIALDAGGRVIQRTSGRE